MDENFGWSSFQVHCGHPQFLHFYIDLFSWLTDTLTMRLRWDSVNATFLLRESDRLLVGMTVIVLLSNSSVHDKIIYLSHAELESYPESSCYVNLQKTKVRRLGEKQAQSGITRTGWQLTWILHFLCYGHSLRTLYEVPIDPDMQVHILDFELSYHL